jgi:hypothetical protein
MGCAEVARHEDDRFATARDKRTTPGRLLPQQMGRPPDKCCEYGGIRIACRSLQTLRSRRARRDNDGLGGTNLTPERPALAGTHLRLAAESRRGRRGQPFFSDDDAHEINARS